MGEGYIAIKGKVNSRKLHVGCVARPEGKWWKYPYPRELSPVYARYLLML